MGVLGLWEILESVGHPVKVEGLEGKVLGVDANIWLYKFIRGFREKDNASNIESHKLGLFNRIAKLLYYRIKPVFVFDGPAPILKRRTLERRQNVRSKTLLKVQEAAMKALAQQLKSQYPNIDVNHLQIQLPELRSNNLVAAEKLGDEDFNLFYLPPETEKKKEEQEDSDDADYTSDEEQLAKIQVDSKDFSQLPAEMRYELLQDVKLKRRRQRGALPEDADTFSKLQLARLRDRRSIQQKIEDCEKEICTSFTGETNLMRVHSDATATILYRNNVYDPKGFVQPKQENSDKDDNESIQKEGSSEEQKTASYKPSDAGPSSSLDLDSSARMSSTSTGSSPVNKTISINDSATSLGSVNKTINISDSDDSENDDTDDSDDLECVVVPESDERPSKIMRFSGDFETNIPDSDASRLSEASHRDQTPDRDQVSRANDEAIEESSATSIASKAMNKSPLASFSDKSNPISPSGPPSDSQATTIVQSQGANSGSSTQIIGQPPAEILVEEIETSDEDDDDDCTLLPNPTEARQPSATPKESKSADDDVPSRNQTSPAPTSPQPVPSSVNQSSSSQQNNPPTRTNIDDESSKQSEDRAERQRAQDRPDSQSRQPIRQPVGPSVTIFESGSQTTSQQNHMANAKRSTNKVTSKIIDDAKELLKLFGIPYIDAAGEAEAQCAKLEELKLTMGTITDDSDIWLFGSQTVYRYFFSDDKYVMQYKMPDIEYHIRMSRENLVCFAMLVGSDYTDGIMNVGPVTALEILSEFPGEGLQPLIDFSEWHKAALQDKKLVAGNKNRKKMLKYKLPEGFPSRAVHDGYIEPIACTTDERGEPLSFTWGTPELDELREYARRNFGWDQKRSDEKLLPVMKRLTEKIQKTIDTFFFKTQANRNPEMFRSKRVNQALNKIAKRAALDTDVVNLSEDEEDS